jgi:hypothetical protein
MTIAEMNGDETVTGYFKSFEHAQSGYRGDHCDRDRHHSRRRSHRRSHRSHRRHYGH